MTSLSVEPAPRAAHLPPVGTLRLGLARGALELKQFFREKDYVVFTFSLPAVLLVLLGSIFGQEIGDTGVTKGQLLAAGMIGAGVISTSFTTLGVGICLDREDGTLKRLRGTPMPPAAYFIGKFILVAVCSVAEVVLILAVGTLMFGLDLPSTPGKWWTFAWVFALGLAACTLLGIAVSGLPGSARSAPAVINMPFLALQFVSGVFITPITVLPTLMVTVASVFPVKWICQGFRSVFLPDELAAWEPAGTWELGRTALVLGAWCAVGLALCLLTFRWTGRRR
ncbi:ABC transporter permease [Saccharothrix australiensis]|uniref:Transport permease protein n=1 Tax=Saccharothrix australiensis TaxID=2072 RepID=A0A495VYX8_9PSEU|nr:ABC transporter permease [Saccharothrix australiensis]RKT54459.1 ABC-2 type transport system permease protein [Saccharothrix australiensis]